MKPMRKVTAQIWKWIIYFLLLFVLFVLQTTVTLHAVFEILPVLIVPFVVAVSMQEREVFALVFGVIAGFMWDYSSGKVSGFNAAILMICCIAISLLTLYLVGNNSLNAMLLCVGTMVIQGLLDFLFGYAIHGYENSWYILVRYILPIILYTVVVTPFIFWLVRFVHNWFEKRIEQ